MPRVLTDGVPIKSAYEPPPKAQVPQQREALSGAFVQSLSNAIMAGVKEAIASLPAPVIKPEVKINSPVYVTTPDVKIPATTVNVPEGKAPVVNVEPPTVTLQTNRPNEWEFKVIERNEFGQIVVVRAKAIS